MVNNSIILRIKNDETLPRYYFYMNQNIQGDFQICISVPLRQVVGLLDHSIYGDNNLILFQLWPRESLPKPEKDFLRFDQDSSYFQNTSVRLLKTLDKTGNISVLMICYAVPVLANQYISTQNDLLYFRFSAEFSEFTHSKNN